MTSIGLGPSEIVGNPPVPGDIGTLKVRGREVGQAQVVTIIPSTVILRVDDEALSPAEAVDLRRRDVVFEVR